MLNHVVCLTRPASSTDLKSASYFCDMSQWVNRSISLQEQCDLQGNESTSKHAMFHAYITNQSPICPSEHRN